MIPTTLRRWIVYDIPGNNGWILYLISLILLLQNGISLFAVVAIIPMVLMLVGVIELISERIAKLDRILPRIILYRGFGALVIGGAFGIITSVIGQI